MDNLEKEDLKERRQMSWNGWFYAIQRIDLLIISISGAGLYVILETFKYSLDHKLPNLLMLKLASGLFLISIIVNLISQFTGKESNCNDMKMLGAKLRSTHLTDETEIQNNLLNIDLFDKKADRFNKITDLFNLGSMVTMCIALVILLIYFICLF